jgi:hypothetical protein
MTMMIRAGSLRGVWSPPHLVSHASIAGIARPGAASWGFYSCPPKPSQISNHSHRFLFTIVRAATTKLPSSLSLQKKLYRRRRRRTPSSKSSSSSGKEIAATRLSTTPPPPPQLPLSFSQNCTLYAQISSHSQLSCLIMEDSRTNSPSFVCNTSCATWAPRLKPESPSPPHSLLGYTLSLSLSPHCLL